MTSKYFKEGMIIGRLTLIKEEKQGNKSFWKTICQCGNEQTFRRDYLSILKCCGKKFECSKCKYLRRYPPLQGKVFGRLTVIKEVPWHTNKTRYLVKCDCGVEKTLNSGRLTSKKHPTKSCGCLARKLQSRWINTTQYPPSHKLRTKNTSEIEASIYQSRNAFVAACYNEKDSRYKNHGLLGHTVCELWRNGAKDFVKWALKNGYKKGEGIFLKEGKSIFSPKNCCILNKSTFNKKNNSKQITFNGKTQNITEWAKEMGCSIACLSRRLIKYESFGMEKVMDLRFKNKKR
jgi:hypothetical protein